MTTWFAFIMIIALLAVVIYWALNTSKRIPIPPKPGPNEWINWACNQTAIPKGIATPDTIEELRELVLRSRTGVRVVGAGHSFTGLVCTTETIISLDNISRDKPVISVDYTNKTAWVKAGARLKDLSPALAEYNLAFKNLGDINVQSLAGATATATHGTGETFPCLSAEIIGIKLLNAEGEIITATINDNPDLVKAAQVSIGALGIILEVEINLTDKYYLHRQAWIEPLNNVLEFAEDKWKQHRNFEFFYLPFSSHCACITHDETTETKTITVDNQDTEVLMSLKQLRDFLSWAPNIRRKLLQFAMNAVEPEEEMGESWTLLSNVREVRFTEMEYHIPEEHGLKALQEVIETIESLRPDAFFPIEVRKTAGDQTWLSPFQGEARISIAVHAFYKEDNSYFFKHIEPIFLKYKGRPHWGKLHSQTAQELQQMYPDMTKFCEMQKKMDPDGKFTTPYLNKILDI